MYSQVMAVLKEHSHCGSEMGQTVSVTFKLHDICITIIVQGGLGLTAGTNNFITARVRQDTRIVEQRVLLHRAIREVCLCIDPRRLYQLLIRPVHRDPTSNEIFSELTCTCCLTGASCGYHSLKLDE